MTTIKRDKRIDIYLKGAGRCFYCGRPLTLDTMEVDHFKARASGGNGGMSNLFPSCEVCNRAKGRMGIETFRLYREQDSIKQMYGVTFSKRQIKALNEMGFILPLKRFVFWFERVGLSPYPLLSGPERGC